MDDAFAGCGVTGRFAVADGVTESVFSGLWARLLVDEFVSKPLADVNLWKDWLTGPRSAWQRHVSRELLPWNIEHQLEAGAAATFVGVQIDQAGDWRAIAVGDACVFHLRERRLLTSFPIADHATFHNRPHSIGSRMDVEAAQLLQASGAWQSGDEFVLTTDALAQFLLRESERDHSTWSLLDRLTAGRNPTLVVAELESFRDSHRLRNDDVVMLLVLP